LVAAVSPSPKRIGAASLLEMRDIPIFRGFSDHELQGLVNDAVEQTYPTGARVVAAGDRGTGLFFLLDGGVDVRPNGRQVVHLGPGKYFGELSLLDDLPRSADVVATESTRCLILTKAEFWEFAMKRPELLRGMLAVLSQRLRASGPSATE
jgi:CRP/FNR family transcriptional regulator, cyclic AMP receptor protein